VTGPTEVASGQIPVAQRRLLAVLAAGVLVVLALAACLRPSRTGMGTHQQLGLPPCTLVALFGIRCPTCGMTTAWAHLMRGSLRGALGASATGTLLGILAMASVPWMAVAAVRGRWSLWEPTSPAFARLAVVLVTLVLMEWILRLSLLH